MRGARLKFSEVLEKAEREVAELERIARLMDLRAQA